MKWDELFCNTIKAIGQRVLPEVERKVDLMLPSMPMVEACRADEFDFFQPFVNGGVLTVQQAHHAAERYRLGKTRSGLPMFWMIDDMMTPLDAHIGDTWISRMLKARHAILEYWPVRHCLFGEHLLHQSARGLPVAVVQSEQSAVMLSELFPECIWMAYATTAHLTPELLAPLQGRMVTIYPRTDTTMSSYLFFLDFAKLVSRQCNIQLRIDDTLEQHATTAQKENGIDIVDFLLDSLSKST